MAQIIHQTAEFSKEQSWQQQLADSFTDPVELLKYLNLPLKDFEQHIKARKLFPMRVPLPFAQLIEKGNAEDPLFKQVMPLSNEFNVVEGYIADPLEEQQTELPGLLHKYKSRVLLMVRGGCAVNCRYCFRRHFPYAENSLNRKSWLPIRDYLLAHPEVNEVIFSGGDPLMASDQQLDWLITEIEKISHIQRLRIHTRLPVVIPDRITDMLTARLAESRLKVIMVLHVNHANEIDIELANASKKITESGITLLNQGVFLKGINDSVEAIYQLSEKLFSANILPYYMFLLDKVAGAAHFDICEEKAKLIMDEVKAELPGFLVPKLAREIGGKPNKALL